MSRRRKRRTPDVSPRRLQRFRLAPGTSVQWSNTSLADGEEIQTGRATADRLGLVTLKGVRLSKGKNRVRIARQTQQRAQRGRAGPDALASRFS